MSLRAALVAVPLCAGAAVAQDLSPEEARILPRVIALQQLNIDPDRLGTEMAMLVAAQDHPNTVDLVIFADRRDARGEALLVARGVAWDGQSWGQAADLSASDPRADGTQSLRILSGNDGIGRTAWTQTLTVALRDSRYVLAGYTYTQRDKIDLTYGVCDVNLLTGSWTGEIGLLSEDGPRQDRSGRLDPDIAPLGDWFVNHGDLRPVAACDLALDGIDGILPPE